MAWCRNGFDGQLRPTDGSKAVLPDTVRKKLTGLKSYWAWMQDNDLADKERHQFTKRPIRDHRIARERMEAQPKAFDVADVPRLCQQAEADADRDLFAITKIGAHTGMRREEICGLKVDQVRADPEKFCRSSRCRYHLRAIRGDIGVGSEWPVVGVTQQRRGVRPEAAAAGFEMIDRSAGREGQRMAEPPRGRGGH